MSQFKLGAIVSYAGILFNVIAGLLYTPWMVNSIGADDYALYTLALSVVNFFIMDFGLGNAISRYLSKYYAEGDSEKANYFLGLVYKVYFVLAVAILIVFLVIFFASDNLYANLGPIQLEKFKGIFLIVAGYSVFSFCFIPMGGILTANEQFVALNLCELARKVFTVALIVVALVVGLGVYSLVLVNAVVNVFVSLAKYRFVRKKTKARADLRYRNSSLVKEILGFSVWVTIVQICQRLIFAVMPSVIAMVSTSWEVALFGLAASLEGYVCTLASALDNMYMPKVTKVICGTSSESLEEVMIRFGRIQLYIIGFVDLCMFCFGGLFVSCWIGEDYLAIWICTSLILLPGLIELPQSVANTAIIAANEVKAKAVIFVVMSAANIVFGLLFAALFGAVGACASIFGAYCIRTFGLNIVYKKRFGIRLSFYFKQVYSRWMLPCLSLVGIGFFAGMLIHQSSWMTLLALVVLSATIYFAELWIFVFNVYEKNLVRSVVGIVRRKG
ncbi:oligosaccharide flippase family protein [Gordonibacter massiliensis (ex Traore et al. 2017)]|uniref:Oligosaccharide flippase family protein n=1 Tax=Gordonibacter massiliensis (ex Traore et al. 2017) TaxID=1841863 RepID=A0A842JHN6_9ACTN|nr:oligosaccharide flippase family protein [Gordonibacter massiliensis (ex Traore et al. 2017)]